jgi:hypothetical protein
VATGEAHASLACPLLASRKLSVWLGLIMPAN